MTVLLLIASIGLLLFSLTPHLRARPNLLIDLPSHFVVQYLAAAIILMGASALLDSAAGIIICACSLVANWAELAPLLPAKTPAVPAGPKLRILQANVLKSNGRPELLRQLIMDEYPDVITCAEVNPGFAAMLHGLKNEYPHQLITTGTDSYRVALLSKLPLLKVEQTAFGSARTEAIVFRVELDGEAIDAVSLHTYTPNANIKSRDSEFDAIAARLAAEKPERLILMGDFNATPWCPAMKQLAKVLKLRNARERRGVNTTWPAFLPFLFRIPIDHVLVSANLGVAAFTTARSIGSDHFPTLTTLYISNI
jgi:endonuclease/exonuclease/phosphatase (EEP) superfamily protein YafD